ncbi:osmoprotectant NAGGN system M42 family peptidase [Aliiglaciecola sp. 3_MG-2023]|uniref:osmoprotectant NAGGN system M42 family peptidase n=1 Tax=Aliiglaciecola sp. 3_MG-2023 TaxID=3062644 RepID=UPI0026E2202F|nr:osmoprotectant NAGGN system M42 family peptidase [Aliiglaciecola sp. 3_MG-2023]MDO6693648.1 osmoprotectant NAGGN system M42 family peptidase [Aliiglaciecola sp. 3_MG-2023]
MVLDEDYLHKTLAELLAIPSPLGYTDEIVAYVTAKLQDLGVEYYAKRRGTIVATLKGDQRDADRAISAHLDTLGAMVQAIEPDGRLKLVPLGTWSARFAEGGRVSVLDCFTPVRGTVLPIKSSGHVYGDDVDTLPVGWDYVQLRLDQICKNPDDVIALGIDVGSIVAFDPNTEFLPNGYISSRYLDDKAGVACLLTAIKALGESPNLAVECHPIFSLSEETGCGCGHAPDEQVGELLSVDIGPVAPGQNSSEHRVNIGIKDTSGVYHPSLSKKLTRLCEQHKIPFRKDVYKFYRSDTHSAIIAGNDLQHGLITFGTESTHGYERTHMDSLLSVTRLLAAYMSSEGSSIDEADNDS